MTAATAAAVSSSAAGSTKAVAAHDDPVAVLNWLASLAPTRLTGTEAERKVQQEIANRLAKSGYAAEWIPFSTGRHIYGSMALHYGLVLAAVPFIARWPLAVALLHLFLAFSWWMEAARRRFVLRELWPKVKTQSVLFKSASSGPVKKRLVFLAHVDSAFTGFMFNPTVLKNVAKPPPAWLPFLKKQLFLPWLGVIALGLVGIAGLFVSVPGWVFWVLAAPSIPVFALNFDVLVRNTVVPGAADNLSGCAVQLVLAEQYAQRAHAPGVEVVFAFTGAEEGGTLGAAHLSRTMGWEKDITEVIALDTLSNGTLHLLEEGELYKEEPPASLVATARAAAVAVGEPEPALYTVPAGGTDALPFLVKGYRALALTCIDLEMHAPRNYHHPNDTADRVDPVQLRKSMDVSIEFLERLSR